MASFDPVLLLREYGDENLVRDLAQLLVDTLPEQVDAVNNAVSASDGAALRKAAHKLRGSIVAFGMADAVERARQLEAMGAAGDLTNAAALGHQLVADVQSLRASANAWLTASENRDLER
jgi:HPt (histidine-containing phosphotransfer) domain-containing protein